MTWRIHAGPNRLSRDRIYATGGLFATIFGFALLVDGCSPAQQQKALAEGQLYCAKATATGPLVVAIATTAGVPVSVIGKTSSAVQDVCALINGIPVTPPPNPTAAPVVAVPLTS